MERMSNCPIYRTDSELRSNSILYEYPCGKLDIISSSRGFMPAGWEAAAEAAAPERAKRTKGKKAEGDDLLRSMRRARAKLRRLALANDFDFFVTLTLDAKRIDRYDPSKVIKALGTWCDNMVRRNGLRYVLVPERHKDGALHFHGFFSGEGLQAVDSGHTDPCGHPVYNLPQWTYGFTAAIRLYGDYGSAVGYVCKYIGKQDGERPCGRWYYSGGALKEPRKIYADLDFRELEQDKAAVEFDIPGSKLIVIHTEQEDFYGKHEET